MVEKWATFDLAKEDFGWTFCLIPVYKIKRIVEFRGLPAVFGNYKMRLVSICGY